MINFLKRIFNKNHIKKEILFYFVIASMLLVVSNFYTYFTNRAFMVKMNTMFMSNVELDKLSNNLLLVEQNLQKYLLTKESNYLEDYIRYSDDVNIMAQSISDDYSNNKNSILLKNIKNCINTYIGQTNYAVQTKRGRDIKEYIYYYNESNKVFKYINYYISELNDSQFKENTNNYLAIVKRLNFVEVINYFIVMGSIFINMFLIIWFTYRITKPIILLSESADEISRGNLDFNPITVKSNYEITMLAQAFNKMIVNIKQNINEIKEKVYLESRLKQQEMQNLIMKNLLKDAKLRQLQSQINPHFLYNTLNTGAQIAMLEGSGNACTFMNNVADFYRFNLENYGKPITLREEINNINTYIYILKTRFEDMIQFSQEIDESVLDILVPSMILQPIVENAYVHGLSETESGGKIIIRVGRKEDNVEISISDNGKGIDEEKLKCIVNSDIDDALNNEEYDSQTDCGIGVSNVKSRLKLFFDVKEVMTIRSTIGKGTDVIIRFPLHKEQRSKDNV